MVRRILLSLALVAGLTTGTATLSAASPASAPAVGTEGAAIDALARLLVSDSGADVARALRLLEGTPLPGLEDALYVAAQRVEPELSSAALDLLAQTGDVRAVELIEDAIRSTDPARVSVATVWLSSYGVLGLEAAERLLDDPDRVVRHAVLRALVWFAPSPEVEDIIELAVAHTDRQTARLATAVLARASR